MNDQTKQCFELLHTLTAQSVRDYRGTSHGSCLGQKMISPKLPWKSPVSDCSVLVVLVGYLSSDELGA